MARKNTCDDWVTPEGLTKIGRWSRDGLTDKQIAKKIGVSERTFSRWKIKFPSIMTVLKKAKEVVDGEVEDSLFKRAIGYTYEEVTEERLFNKATGDYELVVTKKVKKHMPGDTTAMIFWLKNREPDKWRDRVTVRDEGSLEKLDSLIGSIDKLAEVRAKR